MMFQAALDIELNSAFQSVAPQIFAFGGGRRSERQGKS